MLSRYQGSHVLTSGCNLCSVGIYILSARVWLYPSNAGRLPLVLEIKISDMKAYETETLGLDCGDRI